MASEADLVRAMIDEPNWRDRIFGQIVWNRPAWFLALDDRGVWRQWLGYADDALVDRSLRMMSFMSQHFGQRIAPILRELVTRGPEWAEKVAQCLPFGNLEDESDEVFILRLDLARRGQRAAGYIWWERLANSRPDRAMRLFVHHVRLFERAGRVLRHGGGWEPQDTGIELHGRDDLKWLRKAAARQPLIAWRRLAPACVRLERLRHWAQRHHAALDFQSPSSQWARQSRALLEKCERLLVAAGRSLARRRPEMFRRLVERWEVKRRTSLIERSLLRSMTAISDADVDFAALWIIGKLRRLRIGVRSGDASRQEPARKALASIACRCSDETLAHVESAIMRFRDPDLKTMMKYGHDNYAMKGIFHPNHHGKAQYILLSAIPSERLSDRASGQLGVWQRKFGAPSIGRGVRSTSGWVGSTIPSSRLQFLSDKDWIRLATGDWSKRNRGGFRRKVMGKGSLGEASHRHFANDMGAMARRQPSRFARLLLELPDDAPADYTQQVLRAFEQTEPPDVLVKAHEQNSDSPGLADALEGELKQWRPVTADEIEAIFKRRGFPKDAETAKVICWLVDKREDVSWSEITINHVAAMAKDHPDPASDEFASGYYDPTDRTTIVPDVANSGLNCVRGVAALAIKSLLFADRNLYSKLRGAIESLCRDCNVTVRATAIAVCLPILNINRDAAVAHFLAICDTVDAKVFQSHFIDDFLSHTFWSHPGQLTPVVERMVCSDIEEVVKCGAAWATTAWVYRRWCEKLVDRCRVGSQAHRRGIAEVVGESPWDAESIDARIQLLPALFNDDDPEVWQSAARVFWKSEPWRDDRIAQLAMEFIKSPSFAEDPTPLIRGLSEVKGSIISRAEVVFGIADAFAGRLADAAKDVTKRTAADVPDVFKLLLRLYQQAQDNTNRDLQAACLNRWDALLRAGVGGYLDAEKLLDSTDS